MSDPKWEDTEEHVPSWDDTEEVPGKAAPSQMESGARGFTQGGTLGFADEISGGLGAIGDMILGNEERSLEGLKRSYQDYRDSYRKDDQAAKEANPYTYGAGEIGGGVATSFVPGLGFAKGASLAKNAIQGAKIGAAYGLGGSNADLTEGEVGKAAWDTAKGGVLGGATAGASSYVSDKVSKAIADKIANRGRDAARELGIYTPENIAEYGKDHIGIVGEAALDRSFKPLQSTSSVRQELAEDLGQSLYRDQVQGLPVNRTIENVMSDMSVTNPTLNDAAMSIAGQILGGSTVGAGIGALAGAADKGTLSGAYEGAKRGAIAGGALKTVGARYQPALKMAQFLSKNPKYMQMFSEAASRGQNAVATTTFILQQKDPEFQKAMKDSQD